MVFSCGQAKMSSNYAPQSSLEMDSLFESNEEQIQQADSSSIDSEELSALIESKLNDIKELQTLYHNPEIDQEMKFEIGETLKQITQKTDLLKPEFQLVDFNQISKIKSSHNGYFGVYKIQTSLGINEVEIGYSIQPNNHLKLEIQPLK